MSLTKFNESEYPGSLSIPPLICTNPCQRHCRVTTQMGAPIHNPLQDDTLEKSRQIVRMAKMRKLTARILDLVNLLLMATSPSIS